MKEECKKRLAEQKKEFEERKNTIPDLGFSATTMMDPFAGLGGTPTPVADEAEAEDPFNDFGTLGDFTAIEVPAVAPPPPPAPAVSNAELESLRSVSFH